MKTVLFIGNSFTYYHDLPGRVSELLKKYGTLTNCYGSVTFRKRLAHLAGIS